MLISWVDHGLCSFVFLSQIFPPVAMVRLPDFGEKKNHPVYVLKTTWYLLFEFYCKALLDVFAAKRIKKKHCFQLLKLPPPKSLERFYRFCIVERSSSSQLNTRINNILVHIYVILRVPGSAP